MIYVYCPRPSNGALELVKALGAQRLRRFDGMDFWNKRSRHEIREGDTIVCWGASLPELDGVRVLNGLMTPVNKYEELMKLGEFGIPVPSVYSDISYNGRGITLLGRTNDHQGGDDLLGKTRRADFWVAKESFASEYRIHSFDKKSIRAGIKVPREGFIPCKEEDWKPDANLVHPWIRSFDGGWKINYDNFTSTSVLRKWAHTAVKALGLTFGAVDIALDSYGKFKVLEVNSAPGLEGGTIVSYVKAINNWVEEGGERDARRAGIGDPNDDN